MYIQTQRKQLRKNKFFEKQEVENYDEKTAKRMHIFRSKDEIGIDQNRM